MLEDASGIGYMPGGLGYCVSKALVERQLPACLYRLHCYLGVLQFVSLYEHV